MTYLSKDFPDLHNALEEYRHARAAWLRTNTGNEEFVAFKKSEGKLFNLFGVEGEFFTAVGGERRALSTISYADRVQIYSMPHNYRSLTSYPTKSLDFTQKIVDGKTEYVTTEVLEAINNFVTHEEPTLMANFSGVISRLSTAAGIAIPAAVATAASLGKAAVTSPTEPINTESVENVENIGQKAADRIKKAIPSWIEKFNAVSPVKKGFALAGATLFLGAVTYGIFGRDKKVSNVERLDGARAAENLSNLGGNLSV